MMRYVCALCVPVLSLFVALRWHIRVWVANPTPARVSLFVCMVYVWSGDE